MCRPLREVGGGVDDLHCCATHCQETADHSSQSIISSADIKMSNWTAAEIQEMQRLLVSGAVWLC